MTAGTYRPKAMCTYFWATWQDLASKKRADLYAAMRARDQMRMRTLRMTLMSMTNEEVAGASAHDFIDDKIVKVITPEPTEAYGGRRGVQRRQS